MSWPVVTLGELVEVLDARRVPVSAAERAKRIGAVPYYGATGQVGTIDSALFNEPLLLLGEDGVQFFDWAKPKAYTVDGPSWVNNHAHVLRVGNRVDRRFLNHYLNFVDYRGFVNGTTRLKLTQAAMRRLPVTLPPLGEQLRIVELLEHHLSRLDAARSYHNAAMHRLVTLRGVTARRALTGALDAQRSPSDLADVGTADGELHSLPIGWSWMRLGDVAEVVGGVTKDSSKQADASFVEVPYLRVANVQRGHLKLDDVTGIRVSAAKANALRLEPGDVLLNEGGDRDKLARGWVWEGQIPDCIHQNHVFRARITDQRLDPYFLSWTTNTFGGRWAERNGKQSVNLASISLSMIRKMPVIVPRLGEANRIAAALMDRQAEFDRIETAARIAKLRAVALTNAILAAAFSGNLEEPGTVQVESLE